MTAYTNLTRLKIEPHMHQELELGVVTAGRAVRVTNGRKAEFGPGDVWLCNSCEVHASAILETPYSRVTAMVWPSLLAALRFPEAPQYPWKMPFLVPPAARPRTTHAQRGPVLDAARRLGESIVDARTPGRLQARLAFVELLLILTRDWHRTEQPQYVSNGYDRIAPALELARTERRMVRCEEAAAACGLSVNGLNKHFRRLMGATFADYALRYRFGGAARDLVETAAPIKAIARRWGFADPSHLNRVFRRFANCTPAEYRKRPPFPV